jgi:hypothetical protein
VVAELFHAEGRTDMTKLTAAFRNSVNAPKINKKFRMASEGKEAKV